MTPDLVWQPGMTMADAEKIVIMKALRFYEYNQTRTAAGLGLSVKTIANKIKEFSIEIPKRYSEG